MRHHVNRPLLLQSGERRDALSCCFMMLEATFHGENERILDAPWHQVQQWRNARRTALNDRRARYLSMHRAGSRVLTWDAHSDFPFFLFFSFYIFMSCSTWTNILFVALSGDLPLGPMCQIPKHSLEPLPRVPACVRFCSVLAKRAVRCTTGRKKRKRVLGG